MARGKNAARRRSSLDESNVVSMNQQKPTVSRQEVLDGIQFHWKNLSMKLHDFIMGNLLDLSLLKFINFWRNQQEGKSKTIAGASCGCSWYMALQYMIIGQVPEAKALIMNGCFLQQICNTPIEEIINAIDRGDTITPESISFFSEGLVAISSEERISDFLKQRVTPDYQRRMAFATKTDSRQDRIQNYIDQISVDWGSGSDKKHDAMRRRLSLNSEVVESYIEIILVDSSSKVKTTVRCGSTLTLKMLFKQYAEERDVPLRRLRFSYNGRTLFLSSVGNQTLQDLNMRHLDSIFVIDNESLAREEESSGSSSSDESKESNDPRLRSIGTRNKKSPNVSKRTQCRRASWAGPERIIDMEEHLKLQHSVRLSRVFVEASPRFEEVRQKLNAMNLACCPPKDKTSKKKSMTSEPVDFNPNNVGLGGKAGVPLYEVRVGETENLYKVIKPLKVKPFTIDLHGFSMDEALSELDANLPGWIDVAMRGAYPWVISGVIICGGGNQILSEAVDQWIKGNVNVAKAPKRRFAGR